jgi:hypothetical protein
MGSSVWLKHENFGMNSMKKIFSLIAIGFGFASGGANAAIITFEDVVANNTSTSGPQTSNGYRFEPTTATNDLVFVHRNGGPCGGGCVDNGSKALGVFNIDQSAPFEVRMTAVDSSTFSLLSFDYSELFNFTTTPGGNIVLTGSVFGGGTVTASFSIDQTSQSYQTANIVGFSNLTSVLFSSDQFFPTYDNITVTSVPEPGSVALVALAIAGLGFTRRKKQKTV